MDKPLLSLKNNRPKKNILSLWPKQQRAQIETLLEDALDDSGASFIEIENSLLDTTFRVVPVVNKDALCAYFWYVESKKVNRPEVSNNDLLFHRSVIPQWLVGSESVMAYLDQLSIKTTEDIEQYSQQQDDFIPSIRRLIKILDANSALFLILDYEDNQEGFGPYFTSYLSEKDVCHLCHAILAIKSSTRRYVYSGTIGHQENHANTLLINAEIPLAEDIEQGILFSAIDITPTKRAENTLQQRQDFLSTVVKTVPDFLIIYDFEYQKPAFQNEDIIRSLGYNHEGFENSDKNFAAKVAHPEHLVDPSTMVDMKEALQKGDIYEATVRLQDKRGQRRHFHFRSAALKKDTTGNVLNALLVVRDITDTLQTQQILSRQQERYALLAENFSDLIITLNPEFCIDYVSRSSKALLGYDGKTLLSQEKVFSILGLNPYEKQLRQKLNKAITDKPSLKTSFLDLNEVVETSGLKEDGQIIPLELKISLVRNDHQVVEGLLIIGRDITERRAVEANKRLATHVFENALDGIYITNDEGMIVQANNAFVSITGYTQDEILNQKPAMLSSGWHDINFESDIKPSLIKDKYWEGELLSRRANGEAFLALVRITALHDAQQQFLGLITSFKDITEAKSSEEDIKKLAYYDPLTDLPNRSLFDDRLQQALQRGNRNRLYVAILFIDLDGFKSINDKLGHANGDRLLTEVGIRLKNTIRSDDTVARMGGDEFTIILNALPNREMAENATAQIAGKIVSCVSEPFVIQGNPIRIGCSIGISLYPDDSISAEELIKQADTAMYHAKQLGKNGFQFYTTDMYERTKQRHKLEKELLAASYDEEFTLVYQPKFDTASQKLMGFEALIRWRHPEKGLIKPNVFLATAEDLGMGIDLGKWVINHACKELGKWLKAGCVNQSISVNIFERHYREGDLVKSIKQSLQEHQIPPELLTVEITQEVLMNDVGYAYATLSDLKALGVRISIDHFASSLISLQYFNRLPVDEIKINRQFIKHIGKKGEDLRLVNGIIGIAINFGYDVVAEGVETKEQLDLLQAAQFPDTLGFFFSQSMPAEDLMYYADISQPLLTKA